MLPMEALPVLGIEGLVQGDIVVSCGKVVRELVLNQFKDTRSPIFSRVEDSSGIGCG